MPGTDKQSTRNFWVVGINYKKTDASVRGMFAISPDQYLQLLSVAPQYHIHQFFILSTCNRTEIYGFADDAAHLTDFLCSACAGGVATFKGIAYAKNGQPAIEHLFHVAAGLDSQILGDYEILGQIKTAVKQAKEHGFIGTYMERLINCVLQASKAIKTNTALSGGTVSVSFAAIQCIRQHFGCPVTSFDVPGASLRAAGHNKKIVLVGTGKIGRITCRNLVDYLGNANITLINRTEETAIVLAKELNLEHASMEALGYELETADIVLVSTASQEPVIRKEHLAGKGPKLVIDLSVPCNVAADAQALPGITFVDIDTLSKIKDETLLQRQGEVPKALALIAEHIEEFNEWCAMRKHVPVLKEVKKKLKTIHFDPILRNGGEKIPVTPEAGEERIQKVINTLAAKMRRNHTPGCHYIEAINDFIATA